MAPADKPRLPFRWSFVPQQDARDGTIRWTWRAYTQTGPGRLRGRPAAARHGQGDELRIVAVTGWGQEEDREKSREAGFDVHLVKPVDPNDLVRLLEAKSG